MTEEQEQPPETDGAGGHLTWLGTVLPPIGHALNRPVYSVGFS